MGIGDLMVIALSGYVFVNTFDLTRTLSNSELAYDNMKRIQISSYAPYL